MRDLVVSVAVALTVTPALGSTTPVLSPVVIEHEQADALGRHWPVIAYAPNEAIGVDLDTLRVDGDVVVFWTVMAKKETQPASGSVPAFDYALRRDTINCRSNVISSGAAGIYRIGSRDPLLSFDMQTQEAAIRPDSVSDSLRDFVCDASAMNALRGGGDMSPEEFALSRQKGWTDNDRKWLAGTL